jgi:hypothetical protein
LAFFFGAAFFTAFFATAFLAAAMAHSSFHIFLKCIDRFIISQYFFFFFTTESQIFFRVIGIFFVPMRISPIQSDRNIGVAA